MRLLSQFSNLCLDRFQLSFNLLNLTGLISLSLGSFEQNLMLLFFLTKHFKTLFGFLVHDVPERMEWLDLTATGNEVLKKRSFND